MNPYLRQKACLPCATSKRKCDRQLPECHRCLARDVDCVYPQSKRKRPYPEVSGSQDRPPPQTTRDLLPEGASQSNDSRSLILPAGGALDDSLNDFLAIDPHIWLEPPFSAPDLSLEAPFTESSDAAPNNDWFLQGESWNLQPVVKDANSVVNLEHELKIFIDAVYNMMKTWVTTGSNGFIHHRLYGDGIPSCLQDAFLTLSAYMGKAPAVEEVILAISEQKSVTLIAEESQNPLDVADSVQMVHFLARFQALAVHTFARLHSGSVRRRVIAEQHLSILRQWLLRLNALARSFQRDQTPETTGRKPIDAEFDSEYDTWSELWSLWILTESIRRTHLITECWIDAYEALTVGQAPCRGTPMVTVRSGLWDARSAMEWLEGTLARSSLLVASLQPAPVMSRYGAEEVDPFVKAVWQVIVGGDRMKFWHMRKTMN